MRALVLAIALATACSADPEPTDTATDTSDTAEAEAPDAVVISLQTRDGVTLAADYHALGASSGPGVVLVHMIPPNSRGDWPVAFRERLVDSGWAVVNIDRRGAGESEGVAEESYQGPNGKYDVEAAVKHLQSEGYGPIAILGASNGTTSMIDYAAWAGGEGLPEPAAMAFLSGGSYTEAQTAMSAVPRVPAAFLYPPNEAAWSEAQQEGAPDTWTFTAYPEGAHGTRLFTTSENEAVQSDLVQFLEGAFGG